VSDSGPICSTLGSGCRAALIAGADDPPAADDPTYRAEVPTFLSPEWITQLGVALDDALGDAPEPFPPFTVRQVVTDVPGAAEVAYEVTVSGSSVRLVAPPLPADPPDLTVVCDYATALALHRGERSAQEALEAGRLEVRGGLDRITGARKALLAIGDAAGELRATTTYALEP
jgi:hypothetical protein